MKFFLTVALAIFTFTISAQNIKVKIKKKQVFIDKVKHLELVGGDRNIEGTTFLVKSLISNKTLFSVNYLYHDGHFNCKVNFSTLNKVMKVKILNYKNFFNDLYNQSVITMDGEINEENALQYIQLFDVTPVNRIMITD